ncbi:MAG: hypothetical protein BRD43_04880 [Bacteroidetes bacterium QS_4_64_154]|nr:MAG: hypothetical protein BRD43_04880 [Bacteroidetes bacterium QS_4_64_154]
MKKRTRAFRHSLWGLIGTLLVFVFVLSACSDDPILGPTEDSSDDGGSYSSINRLAPPDTGTTAAPVGPPEEGRPNANPERF